MGQVSDILGKRIKELIKNQISFVEGTVISASPLKIEVKGNNKWIIPKSLIIIPKALTNYSLDVDFTVNDTKVTKIQVNNALRIGDTVMMVTFNLMQRYYILDRIGG